jgi:hypothetical protein
MQIFIKAVLEREHYFLFYVISRDKPFIIQRGAAAATGKTVSGIEYTIDMVTDDFNKHGDLYVALKAHHPETKNGLADIVEATGGKDWMEVAPGRFVPPGEKPESPVFVVFRAEWDGWYIDTIGLPAAQAA